MRYLLLSAALMCGGANAVNLSELKTEDVCFSKTFGYLASTPLIQQFPDNVELITSLSVLRSLQFKEGRGEGCRLYIFGYSKYMVSNNVILEYTLVLRDLALPDTDTRNAYSLVLTFPFTSIEDMYLKADSGIDKLYSAFIRDWKQSHP